MLPKKKIRSFLPILLLLTIFSTEVQGQNYALFNKDRYMTFTQRDTADVDSSYVFAKIDSVVIDGFDSIFYFNRFLDTLNAGSCYALNGDTTILGYKMIKKDDIYGTHVFFNNNGDSIFIRNKIADGDVWHMYTWPDGSYVKATVINYIPFSPLPDTPDSIYRVQLNVFTLAGMSVPDSFPNQTKIDLSKDHGLIEFFDFRIFPSPGDSNKYLLRGLTNPYEHKADVDAKKAFGFETGYEYHYREEVAPDLASGADKRISAWKYFVMDKFESASEVSYTMERVLFDTLFTDGTPSSNITWDTVTVTYEYADYGFLDTLELCVFEAINFGYSDWIKEDTIYKGIAHKYVYDWFTYDDETGCLDNPDNISQPEQLYGDGLGLMHYMDSTDAENHYKLDMVYFHVGLLEWGEPYDFSILDLSVENNYANAISVYPNPAQDKIILKLQNPDIYKVHIYSIEGKLVLSTNSSDNSEKMEISVNALNSGYYLMEVIGERETFTTKFIKK